TTGRPSSTATTTSGSSKSRRRSIPKTVSVSSSASDLRSILTVNRRQILHHCIARSSFDSRWRKDEENHNDHSAHARRRDADYHVVNSGDDGPTEWTSHRSQLEDSRRCTVREPSAQRDKRAEAVSHSRRLRHLFME